MLDLFHNPGEIARCDQGVLDPNCHADTQKFHDGIGSLDLLRALRVSRQKCRPLSPVSYTHLTLPTIYSV